MASCTKSSHVGPPGPLKTIAQIEGIQLDQHEGELRQVFTWLDEIRPVRVFVEIGSRFGASLYAFAEHLAPPLTVVSVDLPGAVGGVRGSESSTAIVEALLAREGFDPHRILADSHSPECMEKLRQILNSRPIDFLFVDGDHTTPGALQDLEMYSPLVRPGGMVALHDIGNPYGIDAVSDPYRTADSLDLISDVRAAFNWLARGRKWANVVYKWGIGVVWM